jgi:hypothetical protein
MALKLGQLPQTKPFTEKVAGKGVGAPAISPYSYEHKISLDSAALTKLGANTPKVGDHLLLHAKVLADDAVGMNQQDAKHHKVAIHKVENLGHAVGVGGAGGLANAVDKGIKQGTAAASEGNV